MAITIISNDDVWMDVPSGKLTQLLKMAIEIVDLPIKNGDVPQFFVCLPEGRLKFRGETNNDP